MRGLFQPRVLRLGFLQDGNIRVGVFPEREEILVLRAGFGGVPLHGVSPCQSEAGQRTPGEVHAAQEFLEARVGVRGLFQLCVLRLGFLQDGDVGVSVFPEGEEVLIGSAGFGASVL